MKAKDSNITNVFIEDRKNYANKRDKKFRYKIHVYFYRFIPRLKLEKSEVIVMLCALPTRFSTRKILTNINTIVIINLISCIGIKEKSIFKR